MNKNSPFQDWLDANTQGYAFSAEIRELLAKAFEGGQSNPQVMHPEMKKLWEGYFDKAYKQLEPLKREWVGLTDDEVGSIEHWVMFKEAGSGPIPVLKLIAYIEAKLKEKNYAV